VYFKNETKSKSKKLKPYLIRVFLLVCIVNLSKFHIIEYTLLIETCYVSNFILLLILLYITIKMSLVGWCGSKIYKILN